MENWIYYIIPVVLLIAFVAIALTVQRKRKYEIPYDPYTEALKKLVDGDRETAFTQLQHAVKRGSAPTDAYIKLGELLREQGQAIKALQIHQSLTVKTNLSKRENTDLYVNIAEDYAQLGKPDRSAKVLDAAIRNFHLREPQIYASLAGHYHLLGEHEKAFDSLKELKRFGSIGDRELALYLTSAAEHPIEAGNMREAKKLLYRALKLDGDCAPALLMLGNIEENDSPDEAIRLWKHVAAVSPELAGAALQNLEKILFQRGRFGEIERIYQDVLASRDGDEVATIALASFYKKQGREEDALSLLEEFHISHPKSAGSSILLTSLYAKLRNGEMLETFLEDSVKRFTQEERFVCKSCRFETRIMRWHCPKCNAFDSYSAGNET